MEMEKKVIELNLDDVLPNRFQPRIKFDEEALMELSESIKEHGIIQPIVVRPIGDKYEIIAGERRYKASVIAGKNTIPSIVTNLDDKESAEIALIENVQREDLTPIEEAVSYRKILDMGYLTQEQLADKLDLNQSTISNKLRLLNLDDEVQESLLNEKISERHARSLLKIKDKQEQKNMLNRIINERLTVRKTDEAIDILLNKNKEEVIKNLPDIEKLEEKKGDNEMDNKTNDDIFNIPSEPIIEEIEMPEINPININDDSKTTAVNPGFMDIDKIEEEAKDIYTEKPAADINNLLQSTQSNNIQAKNNEDNEENGENFELNSGKFFNINNEETNDIIQTNKPEVEDVFSSSNSVVSKTQEKEENVNPIFTASFGAPEEVKDNTTSLKETTPDILNKTNTLEKTDDLLINLDQFSEVPEVLNFGEEPKNPESLNSNTYGADNLKMVINTIRECASTIEKYGFIIETEELDFEDTYQVTFKVNKKKS